MQVQLNFTIQTLLYNTTGAYYKCSLNNRLCVLELFLLRANVAILTTPGPKSVKKLNVLLAASLVFYFSPSVLFMVVCGFVLPTLL